MWSSDSKTDTLYYTKPGQQQIVVEVPEPLHSNGGPFSVAFTKITDGNGCVNTLGSANVKFNVDTTRVSVLAI